MRAGNLLSAILDLGKAMIVCGGEVWRVEEVLGMLCETYCFKEHDFLIMSNSLQATVQTWDGRIYTQIRGIRGTSYDLDKLEKLFLLAMEVRKQPLAVNTLREKIYEIIEGPGITWRRRLAGSIIAACGFCLLYNGDVFDVISTAIIAVVVYQVSKNAMGLLNNTLTANTFSAFAMEALVLLLAMAGMAHHPGAITIATMLLLISGIGVTSGFKDLLHGDALSGIVDTTYSILGAVGIAIGITLAMFVFPGSYGSTEVQPLVAGPALQILYCVIGCTGFALLFGARGRTLIYSAIGGAITWAIFLLTYSRSGEGVFLSSLAGSCFVGFFSLLVEKLRKIPAIVILTACVFPLIPGSYLYFTVMGAIVHDHELFKTMGVKLVLICIGISAGFIIADVVHKYMQHFKKKRAASRNQR